jgi:hypothetical protein
MAAMTLDRVRRAVDATALTLALAKLVVEMNSVRSYGFFRDELYYLACTEHLAWGYVDHPPLSIAILRVWRAIAGDSLVALRFVPALAGAAVLYVTARTARALGGGTLGAAIAGGAVLVAPGFLAVHRLYSMNAIDHLVWAIVAALAVRIADEPEDRRAWIGLGIALGLGGLNKWSVAWLAPGIAVGFVAVPQTRRMLRTPWPWLAVAIAAVLVAPHVSWEVGHRWPTLEFMKNALEHKYVAHSAIRFVVECLLLANPAMAVVVVAGVVAPLVRWRRAGPERVLAIAFAIVFAILASSRSAKAEYVLSALPLAIASGAAWWASFLDRGGLGRRALAVCAGMLGLAFAALVYPFAIPVLSEERFVAYAARVRIRGPTTERKELGALPQHYADMHGWPELARGTAAAWSTLSPTERTRAKIWVRSGGYGAAAAIDFFGPALGLPRAINGQNSYWMWGYGRDDDDLAVVVGGSRERLGETFSDVVLATTVTCRWCMPAERDTPIYVARRLRRRWSELWPMVKSYE